MVFGFAIWLAGDCWLALRCVVQRSAFVLAGGNRNGLSTLR
jgi:hypothetical protein